MNFKRVLSLLLVCVMLCGTVLTVSAARDFYDLPSSHWAYANVQTLVADGTINGYEDGSFQPDAKVTRAEFVKMIGKTNVAYSTEFIDVSASHWGYEYIMYSNMDVEGNRFKPDVAITRNDVVKLLHKRAGAPKGFVAPSIITNQSDKADAVAWAYNFGIMKGDDGISLRLNDGLTRAEAAALICRSRELNESSYRYSFSELVNDDLLKRVYNSFDLFTGDYNPERTFTNGEIAEAAMRIAADQTLITYDNFSAGVSVNRKNTLSFYVICKNLFGEDKMTEAFYDAKANNLDAITALMYAFDYKVNKYLVSGKKAPIYADVTSVYNDTVNKFITAAFENGIRLDNSNNINPNDSITARNLAMILLQMDALAGINTNYSVTVPSAARFDASLKTEILNYPDSHNIYRYILKDVPNEVYAKPFVDVNGVTVKNPMPKNCFDFVRDYNYIFTMFIQGVIGIADSMGTKTRVIYYPSMVCETENGYVLRVKVEIKDTPAGTKFNDVFLSSVKNDFEISSGMTFYADLATGSSLDGMSIPLEKAQFTQIVYSVK